MNERIKTIVGRVVVLSLATLLIYCVAKGLAWYFIGAVVLILWIIEVVKEQRSYYKDVKDLKQTNLKCEQAILDLNDAVDKYTFGVMLKANKPESEMEEWKAKYQSLYADVKRFASYKKLSSRLNDNAMYFLKYYEKRY